jgi:excisionase family DNA binding protein
MNEPMMNAQSAAEMLGLPPTWLLRKARDGQIPHVRFGRYVRFERVALREWVTTQRCGA